MALIEHEWASGDLETLEECAVCGSRRLEPLGDPTRDRTIAGSQPRWQHVRCGGCGAALLDPRPRTEALRHAYRVYYTHRPPIADPRSAAERAGLPWRLLGGYLGTRYGYQMPRNLGRLGWAVALAARGPRATADRFVRNLPRSRPERASRLLDVGCGNGDFLLRMHTLGWEVFGIEPDPVAAAAAEQAGLPVLVGEVPRGAVPGAPFDAITMSHVIEHVPDPVELLRRCHALLRPGGVIWVLTPNLSAPGRTLFGRDWVSWDAPRHLVLFNRSSLVGALGRAGFHSPRTCLPLVNARSWLYPVSQDVREGGIGEMPRALSRRLSLRARAADLAVALGRVDSAEELCVMAQTSG